MMEQIKRLIYSTYLEYLASNCISEIGNSFVYKMNIKAENSKKY